MEKQTESSVLKPQGLAFSILLVPSFRQDLEPGFLDSLEERGYKAEIVRLVRSDGEALYASQQELAERKYYVGRQWNQVKTALFGLCLCKSRKVIVASGGITLSADLLERMVLSACSESAEVVIASRFFSNTTLQYPIHQRLLSRLFRQASRLAISSKITDPRSGVKLFDRQELLRVLSRIVDSSSDLHLLPLTYFRYARLTEVPALAQPGAPRYPLSFRVLLNALSDLVRAAVHRTP